MKQNSMADIHDMLQALSYGIVYAGKQKKLRYAWKWKRETSKIVDTEEHKCHDRWGCDIAGVCTWKLSEI